ncbi:MAG TPA: RdgB/HAM1 family non-canonical purine NTP pyrophosphatase [Polyangiaceae bacterium]|nr:RdgB/HAM1 family non-canonical purine NTP pyrophosphatase [Polyangiaceae bacterium]
MTPSASRAPITLVIATSNLGKLEEIRKFLDRQPITLARPEDILGQRIEVVEDGETFEANAEIKARAIGERTGHVTLADDSGLEVDALGGLPGVRSARFAGEKATDAENNRELLRRLDGLDQTTLSARFRCAMALFDPARNHVELTHGTCEGRITRTPRGTLGFGYDPLFEVAERDHRTLAELETEDKNLVSHRGKALRAMVSRLLAFIARP